MPIFVKTEKFTERTLQLTPNAREAFLKKHKAWVEELRKSGRAISSGYLCNKEKKPGGGGLLVIKASSFEEAKSLIELDPMIKNNLVTWNLQEWVPLVGSI